MSKLADALNARNTGFTLQTAAPAQPASAPVLQPTLQPSSNPLQSALKSPLQPSLPTALPMHPPVQQTVQEFNLEAVLNATLELTSDVEGRHADGANIGNFDLSTLKGQYEQNLQMVAAALKVGDVTEAMYRCMTFIDKHLPQLENEKLILPEDIGLLVRSLQLSNGVIIAKKMENKGTRAKSKTTLSPVDLESALANLALG